MPLGPALLLLAALPLRPPCTAANRGDLWPPNPSAPLAALCLPLEVCSARFYGARWETIRLPYWRLASRPAPAACPSPSSPSPLPHP